MCWNRDELAIGNWAKCASVVLQNGAYELIDYEGYPLAQPRIGLYLKKYYA